MILSPSFWGNFALGLTAWGAAFIAALWLGLVFWTYRDIRARTRDRLMRILAVLVAVVLFLPGIVVYLILRPPRTLEEEYQQSLEEEALLQSIEDVALCPGCGRKVQESWQLCPSCHTRLKKPCLQCGKLMELPWNLCPYCGAAVPGMRTPEEISLQESAAMPEVRAEEIPLDDALRPVPADEEQVEEEGRVEEEQVEN